MLNSLAQVSGMIYQQDAKHSLPTDPSFVLFFATLRHGRVKRPPRMSFISKALLVLARHRLEEALALHKKQRTMLVQTGIWEVFGTANPSMLDEW